MFQVTVLPSGKVTIPLSAARKDEKKGVKHATTLLPLPSNIPTLHNINISIRLLPIIATHILIPSHTTAPLTTIKAIHEINTIGCCALGTRKGIAFSDEDFVRVV